MTLDGLLTLLTLLVAIYTLLPRVTKLRAKLGLGLQRLLAGLAFLLVLYIHFFEQIINACLAEWGEVCEQFPSFTGDLFSPSESSFIVALAWSILAWVTHKLFSRPKASSSLATISKIVDNLIYEQRHAELIELVGPWLPLIDRASRRSLPLQKLHDRIISMKRVGFGEFQNNYKKRHSMGRESSLRVLIAKRCHVIANLAVLIPAQRRAESEAIGIVRALCQSKDLRNYVIKVRPYFALPILTMRGSDNFLDAYLTGLISDTNSILYQEFERNSRFPPGIQPLEGNQILGALLNDASVAEKLNVWNPIKNHVLALLSSSESPDPEFTASLNRKAEDFGREQWGNPIFAGIYFYDVMVTSAARQGIRWHMWLYHLGWIVEKLENNYDTSDPKVNESDEFPTRSARLIYEAVGVLRNWILLVKELPENSPHMKSEVLDVCTDRSRSGSTWQSLDDNSNIPVSAANTFGFCMNTIVLSERINEKFKCYIYEIVVDTIRKLEDPWYSMLIQCTVRAGSTLPVCDEYGRKLYSLHSQIDHYHRKRALSDIKDALEHVYGTQ